MKQLLPLISFMLLLPALSFAQPCDSEENPINVRTFLTGLNNSTFEVGFDTSACVYIAGNQNNQGQGNTPNPTFELVQVNTNETSIGFANIYRDGQLISPSFPISSIATFLGPQPIRPVTGDTFGIEIVFTGIGDFTAEYKNSNGESGTTINVTVVASSVAPVNWTRNLDYEPFGENIKLNWSVAEQVDVAGYELERMTAGQSFEKVAEIAYRENGSLEVDYSVVTNWPVNGTYYRIKQLDYAGTYDYSNVVFVEGNDAAVQRFDIFPNPASSYVRMSVPQEITTVDLISASGQVVRSFTAAEVRREGMDVSNVSAGMYLVRPVGGDTPAKPQRLVVSH